MTTRSKIVAEHLDERTYVHELPFLNEEESWELFCRKTFPNDDEVGDEKICCPRNLESMAREMVKQCRGLPLALVVLGGILRRKHTGEWSTLKDQIWRHVTKDPDHVKHILELSFNDLPHHLKSCFLYLGLFPEDYEIDAERLCWLWEAEGFIKLGEETFEGEYLQELIDRSLILVSFRNWRRIVTCRVHDLVRDLAIQKSKELNFFHIYDETDHSPLTTNSRRLASHCGFWRFVSLDHSYRLLRTLLFFNLQEECGEVGMADLPPLFMKLRLLRVLDLEELSFPRSPETEETRLFDEIGKHIHLRYLGLRGTNLNHLPPSIGKLHALQTLELGSVYSDPIQLPDEIRNAKQLKRLIGRFKWPFPVDNLTKLQTLKWVVVEGQMEFDPTGLINLRELWVEFVGGDKRSIMLDSIGELRNLQAFCLKVELGDSGSFPALQPLSQCQNLIQMELHVTGTWNLPADVHQFPPNLKYLGIDANLTEDPFPVLEKLPNLTVLKFWDYGSAKLACSAVGFPQLDILDLSIIYHGELEVEGGGMPMLKGLGMGTGLRLSDISERLRYIPEPPDVNYRAWLY